MLWVPYLRILYSGALAWNNGTHGQPKIMSAMHLIKIRMQLQEIHSVILCVCVGGGGSYFSSMYILNKKALIFCIRFYFHNWI